ncbi:hypothetical protein [Pontibacter burrus]|uniref:Glycosyltransferase RgtA/B/C/D-like domain-containing protein n=1 Tax=Pontibacter burrus TaxID=2704466 RepID=A0A6B3LRT7_9BACT|nr:hypothetical protein [Pontibacter burrus]NEM96211.1 hypothetical protein [Pontibacter burrus]
MAYLKAFNRSSAAYLLYAGLAAFWVLVQFLLYSKHGIKVVFDSKRYLAQAGMFATGDYSSLKISYIVYTTLLALSNWLGGLGWIVLLQTIVSGLAMVAMYKAACKLTGSELVAALTTFLLILWPDFQFWNLYIHTESLFVSVTCLVFWRLVTANKKSHYLHLSLLLLVVLFLRPNGFMVAVAVFVYWGIGFCKQREYNLWKAATLLLSLASIVVLIVAHLFLQDISSDHSFTKFLVSGEVIQGYEPLRLEGITIAQPQGSPLQQTVAIVLSEPWFFLKQSLLRLLYYWGQVRPYYSLWHNVAIVALIYPLYLLGIKALLARMVEARVTGFIVFLMLQLSAMVVVSAVDWDNRFFLPLLPFVFLLGAIGIKELLTKRAKQVKL